MVPGALIEARPPLMERPCRELTGRQGGSSAGSGQDQLFLHISPKSKLRGRKSSAPNTFFCCCWFLLCLEMLGYGFPE